MFFNYFPNTTCNPFMFYPTFINPAVFNQKNFELQQKVHENIILYSQTVNPISLESKSKIDNKLQEESTSSHLSTTKTKKQIPKIQKQTREKDTKKSQKKVKKIEKVVKYKRKPQILQKQGRNSHSNIFRKFFKLLSVEAQIKQMVKKIIIAHNLSIDSEQFFALIRIKSIDHRNYIRSKEVLNFFECSNVQISKIIRILFKNYLKNYYMVHLLSSKKTDRKSIILHLQGRRTIENQLGWSNDQQSESVSSSDSQSILQRDC